MSKRCESGYLLLLALLAAGCAGTGGGLGSMQKTGALRLGMERAEVVTVLGAPGQAQFAGDELVWRYTLHQPWKGFVPYYLIFDGRSQRLVRWYADEAEFQRQQQVLMQGFQQAQQQQQAAQRQGPTPSSPGGAYGSQPATNDDCDSQFTDSASALCACHQMCGADMPSFPPPP